MIPLLIELELEFVIIAIKNEQTVPRLFSIQYNLLIELRNILATKYLTKKSTKQLHSQFYRDTNYKGFK